MCSQILTVCKIQMLECWQNDDFELLDLPKLTLLEIIDNVKTQHAYSKNYGITEF